MEEFDRESPLFDRRLNVLVQYPDRDEKLMPLTIRLLNGTRQTSTSNQKERVLRVEITDDEGEDPFFLYLWSVSEEEFHDLKQQQRLLIDFSRFPANLIELLNCCSQECGVSSIRNDNHDDAADMHVELNVQKSEDANNQGKTAEQNPNTAIESGLICGKSRPQGPLPLSYLAVLNTCNNNCVFSIVETNPFKHLTHLSLSFAAGNDAAIKSYLAARLRQISSRNQLISHSLEKTMSQLESSQRQVTALTKQLEHLEQDQETQLVQQRIQLTEELHATRDKAAELLKSREDELLLRLDAANEKYAAELKSLRTKLEESEKQAQQLSKQEYQKDLRINHLQNQLKETTELKTTIENELLSIREANQGLDGRVFDLEKARNQLELRVQALQQQVSDKEDVIAKTSDLLAAARQHKQQVEESLQMYRDNHSTLEQKLELSIAEINKGNEIIERIQTENRALRVKMRMKTRILKQQEQLIDDKQLQKEDAMRAMKAVQETIRQKEDEVKTLQGKVKELSQKLDDSNKLLSSNQQVISWLNKEINEAQIAHHKSRTRHTSVFSFNPTSKIAETTSATRTAADFKHISSSATPLQP